MTNQKNAVDPFHPQWLEDYTEEELERLAIMTVDGGLSDEKAVELLIESERKSE